MLFGTKSWSLHFLLYFVDIWIMQITMQITIFIHVLYLVSRHTWRSDCQLVLKPFNQNWLVLVKMFNINYFLIRSSNYAILCTPMEGGIISYIFIYIDNYLGISHYHLYMYDYCITIIIQYHFIIHLCTCKLYACYWYLLSTMCALLWNYLKLPLRIW